MEACNFESAVMVGQHVRSQGDPRTVLTYLTFLEKKIGYLRGIITSASRQIVSAELSCIAVQLVSISKSLAAKTASDEEDADKSTPPPFVATAHELDSVPPYEVIQLEEEEILAPHVHTCKVCGKGFKRDANLRMHMRGHGEEYKTAAALAKPETRTTTTTTRCCVYSCPFVGCKRNREHRSFQPLKTAVCVKNHYRRSHCDKRHACRRCGVKRFSVLADLRTHEKHCGRDRWTCSCGTSFSRKDKLFAHVAAFHDDDHQNGSDPHQVLMVDSEATFGRMTTMADSMFDDFDYSSADIKGFTLSDGGRRFDNDDGRGFMSLMGGIDSSCDFDGVDLFGMPGLDFGTPCLTGF